MKQKVERQTRAMARLGLREAQRAAADGKIGSRRNDIEVVARDRHSVDRLKHGHRRVASEQVHHHAFVGRVEVLHQDEGHAGIGRQRVDELPTGLKTTCRGANSDDREIRDAVSGGMRRLGRPA